MHYQSGGTNKYQEVLIRDNSFRIGDIPVTLSKTGKAEIKNVVTDPARGKNYLDTAFSTRAQPDQRACGFQALGLFSPDFSIPDLSSPAIGRAKALRRVLGQVECVEIGAAAQHCLSRKLVHDLPRFDIDDLGRAAAP